MVKINDVLNLQPRATDPSSGVEGDIYYNSTDKAFKINNGTGYISISEYSFTNFVKLGIYKKYDYTGVLFLSGIIGSSGANNSYVEYYSLTAAMDNTNVKLGIVSYDGNYLGGEILFKLNGVTVSTKSAAKGVTTTSTYVYPTINAGDILSIEYKNIYSTSTNSYVEERGIYGDSEFSIKHEYEDF